MASPAVGPEVDQPAHEEELQAPYHRLNNQLGIVLANAELLESRARDAAAAVGRPSLSPARSRPWLRFGSFAKEGLPQGFSTRHRGFELPGLDPFEHTQSKL